MNILIIGSAHPGLSKACAWLHTTTWIINKLIVCEERTSKLAWMYDKLKHDQPHPFGLQNLSICPDGETGQESQFQIGRSMDINRLIDTVFPDGAVDYLFLCVKNSKGAIILGGINNLDSTVKKYYLNEQDHYE